MSRRGMFRSAIGAAAAAIGPGRFAMPAQAQTKHTRLYVEMDIAPGKEKEMLDTFHANFVPEATKHAGYIRVKLLKRRTIIQGTAPPITTTVLNWNLKVRHYVRSGLLQRGINECGRQ